MGIVAPYQKRPIRFLGLACCGEWTIKCYSISCKNEYASEKQIQAAKDMIPEWLLQAELTQHSLYKAATLIIHDGRDHCYAIISWWTGENMLQLFAYIADEQVPDQFHLISDKGIISCVWEMAILWFERNAWVSKFLMQPETPDALNQYLQEQLNDDL